MATIPSITDDNSHVIFANEFVTFGISKTDGWSDSFKLNRLGEQPNLLRNPFTFCWDSTKQYPPISMDFVAASQTEGNLKIHLSDGVTMTVRCRAERTYFLFELTKIETPGTSAPIEIEAAVMAQLRIDGDEYGAFIGTAYYQDFIISELALNLNTQVFSGREILPEAHYVLRSQSYAVFTLLGAKIALLACPKDQWLALTEDIELQYGLPHPTIDGVWAKKHPDVKSSYLFADITPKNSGAMIQYARRGKFKYIMAYASPGRKHWEAMALIPPIIPTG